LEESDLIMVEDGSQCRGCEERRWCAEVVAKPNDNSLATVFHPSDSVMVTDQLR